MMRACSLTLAFLFLVEPTGTAQDQLKKPQPSKNLLINPSFEGTLTTDGLPDGWSRWEQADGKYRFEVDKGVRTGKKCLKIEGEGIRGVAFTHNLRIDRDKPHPLRGWVNFNAAKQAPSLTA